MSQELDNNVLDLAKQKRFYSYEYMSDCKTFKEELPNKEVSSLLTGNKKLETRNMNVFLRLGQT